MWQERLNEFVTLLIVVNPISALSMFLALAGDREPPAQRRIALMAVAVSFGVLLFFVVAGGLLLEKMGISLRSFQVAGGIVLFLVALDMVRGASFTPPAALAKDHATSLAIYPLAIPKIAGPGTMLTVVLVTDDHRFDLLQLSLTTGVIALVLVITLVALLLAGPISRVIGAAGTAILGRVMGMLLIALAVHTVLSALSGWLGLPKP